ncbi:MAG TPA: DUF4199 domain-containing protein [Bacteroidia bacterium]|jgi:hypothetical protein
MKITLNVKLAVIFGIIGCIAWFVFAKAFGYYSLSIYLYKFLVALFLLISGIFISIYLERKANGGLIDFRNALKSGVLFSIIFSGIQAGFNYIYYKFIAVDALDYFISQERKAGLELGRTLEEVNKNINEYIIPSYGSWHTFMTTFIWGLLLSLLASAVLRKKPPFSSEN